MPTILLEAAPVVRHLSDRATSADSRFGWCRTLVNGRPLYKMWRVQGGKRYTIHAFTIASDRWAIAREIWKARRALKNTLAGKFLFADEADLITVTRYIRGRAA